MTDVQVWWFMVSIVAPMIAIGVALVVGQHIRYVRMKARANESIRRLAERIYANQNLTREGAHKAFADWKAP